MFKNRLAVGWAVCAGLLLSHCAPESGVGGTGSVISLSGGSVVGSGGLLGTGADMVGGSGGTPGTGGLLGTGSDPVGGTGGIAATGGVSATGGAGTGAIIITPVAGTTAPGFMSLAVAPTQPLTADNASSPPTPPPSGWRWYEVEGALCRNGSKTGLYLHDAGSDKLIIFYEGGGACTTEGFCHFNPDSVDMVLTGTGETVLGTAAAAGPGRQQPGVYQNGTVTGIFDTGNAENPFKDWNMVYIPYCTGDVHFGTNQGADIEDVPNLINKLPPQKMVGYENSKLIMARLAATYQGKLSRGIVTGSSAGSFGAALNFSMIQDTFEGVRFDAILDSGAPFEDNVWPPCQQKRWRDLFGLNGAFPPDCTQCKQADGGGLLGMADFLIDKHPLSNIAMISTINDEVIRLFLTPGENNCATITTADPFELTLGQIGGAQLYGADKYEQGLLGVRAKYVSTDRLATYYMGGAIANLHQHVTRPRFFEASAGGVKMSKFVADFLAGNMTQVGP